MIKCVIVEDERLAREKLELYVKDHQDLHLEASFISGEDFLTQTDTLDYELLLVDIGLPNIDGITLAGKLPNKCSVIFTTAYSEYAVEAFNLNATDYLLKPFDFERFLLAIEKVNSKTNRSKASVSSSKNILLKEGKKIHRLSVDNILYIKGLREYVVWHTLQGQLITLHSLSQLSEYLKTFNFVQTHKSYIINAQKVSAIEYRFVQINSEQIPIGRKYRELVKKKFKADLLRRT